ncbi:DEHA2A01628p [Debaryomyces hansenii CBS767]|uniref:Transcription elongation factor SPT5 n=1 Tax=Debaryomyces hansenii (strain ATCC 36239 / CBS 767 / BCRC 21394 / JCM 1990 / NBRC 0083 / IGC 2968) TaxID=284592 RepID=SPT5_DEBHA|nr:DEHA2A01628p [Debaryomyces hansenii CBS767]Q6BZG0.2 RecName: Full=Transcription elongation factor SPT5; AltName: Full=Chromatin elongation factor SPT5 [Debaryomyces hansenii CBS767]CAG84361.2 DEHA2A01628p [Debaryomyces hansenii CBS767]|eukprot:XP_456409.2 DEHA2A01628p [Debaryomyces hansenii CBS767]
MSEEENRITTSSDDVIKHEHPDNSTAGGAYEVQDRDQNDIDEEEEEKEENKRSAEEEYSIGSKRSLEDSEEGESKVPTENDQALINNSGEGAEQQDNGDEANDDENDDENDEDEDEDEDEEEVSSNKRKRRRGANQFIDIEAEVDDEEEDEMDEDDEEAELLREQFIADDSRVETMDGKDSAGEHQDDRLHRQFDRRRQEAEDQDAEVLAETLKQRYRKTHTVYRGDTTASGTVSQKLLMPSINDPAIYAIRCTPGREKDLVRKLYEKKRTLARSNPLEILTVFQRDSFKGYIYIEAKKPEAIERALTGMVNIYAKQRLLVPVREYPDLLKQVKSSDVEIVPGIYVRITRGKYKNDLAIVDNLSENGLDVRCKLVPRLDYGKNDDFDKDGKRIRSKTKPIPRLFSEQEARMYDGEYLQSGRGPRAFIYRGEEYNEGFLFKDFKLQFIQTKDVHPKLEELDRFQTGDPEEDGLDLAAIAASLKNKNNSEGAGRSSAFQPGDKVEIRRGEQAKTIGKVLSTSLNEITILVTDSGDPKFVNQRLTVPANDLRKLFSAGDHVRVIEGKHSDETGLVIKIDNDSVILLSDQTKQDVRVFANYLIKATDASSNTDVTGGKYDLNDLVQLNVSTVGVIVKAEKSSFEVLTSEGRLMSVNPAGIASKLELSRREQIATDRNGSTVKIGDTVKEVLGDKKREGAILHIYKNSLFIKSNEILENLGVFVTNCMNVSTITTKDSIVSKSLGPDLNRMNPNLKLPNPIANAGLKTRVGGRDKLIYKDVLVNSGNYKGLMGKVTEADEVYARIELHTKSKKIKVTKNSLSVLVRGEAIPYLRFIGASSGPGNSNPSGNFGGASFNQPAKTPAFSSGGKSSWGSGGATPSVGGGATAWGSGGAQSSWGGGKTPAYNSGNASTWGGNAGGASAWGNNNGNASTWGSNSKNGGSSTWGGNSTWGNSNKGGKSSWGNGSAWGGK